MYEIMCQPSSEVNDLEFKRLLPKVKIEGLIQKYLDGSSDASQVAAAINNLQSNIIALISGRIISGVDIRPLPSDLSEFVSSLSF